FQARAVVVVAAGEDHLVTYTKWLTVAPVGRQPWEPRREPSMPSAFGTVEELTDQRGTDVEKVCEMSEFAPLVSRDLAVLECLVSERLDEGAVSLGYLVGRPTSRSGEAAQRRSLVSRHQTVVKHFRKLLEVAETPCWS